MYRILLVPIGSIDSAVLQWLSVALQDSLRLPCSIASERIDPADTFHPARQQYYSTQILSRLAAFPEGDSTKILGVAAVDLFIPILTFVFGEAQLGKRAALISTHRLHQAFYGLPADEKLFYERVEKEAIHELGHAFGLIHCGLWECVMHFSNSIEHVDLKSNSFCNQCAASIPR
jgi:archaemetzincin